jgi:acetylglutamate kinase
MPDTPVEKAKVLLEALPYLQAFRGKIFVIKYGGAALAVEAHRKSVLKDIVFLSVAGIRPVLVHGAGKEISRQMEAKGHRPRFVQGLRVTDARTLQVVIRALAKVNRLLVSELRALGARAQGLMGHEARLIQAEPYSIAGEDLGFVGKVTGVHVGPIKRLLMLGNIPVVAPIGVGWNQKRYNVNADEAAANLAAGLKAEKFVLVTDVPGILRRPGRPETLIPTVTIAQARRLIRQGIVAGGMIPKTQACIHALEQGVRKTHLIDVAVPHGLLLEIFTDRGIGTEIVL